VRAFALVLLLLGAATVASAQTGWIEGRVTDGERPLRYANVVLAGTQVGAMTDEDGRFRLRAPCGRFTLRALAFGCSVAEERVPIRKDKTTQVLVVLERVEVQRQERVEVQRQEVPWWRPASDPEDSQLESREVDEALEATGRKAGIVSVWPYPASTRAVRQGDLEFSMRYVMAEQGDSVIVNVIAEGRNAANDPVTVCGCFSLWNTRYRSGPDDLSQMRLAPAPTPEPGTVFTSLDVSPLECDGSRFKEVPRVLLPGETIARGMVFSFYPNAFTEHPGELWVYGVFLSGHRGDAWEDTELVDLGWIKVPIRPIRMPIRP
jgi:hypothetical protein